MRRAAAVVALCLAPAVAPAQDHPNNTGTNAANNPLTPKLTTSRQDYYVPSLYGAPGRTANQALLRGIMPADFGGLPQIYRATLPIVTNPTFPSGYDTGLGDLSLQQAFIFQAGHWMVGAGPMLVLPTASKESLGAGKWQAGVMGVAVAPLPGGLFAMLATYQQSFAGDKSRDTVRLATAQPIGFYNLPDGFYLRSTGTWTFDLAGNNSYIPLGLGIGKVWEIGEKTTVNAFVEPQYTVWRDGAATVPQWQIYAGINFQFALR